MPPATLSAEKLVGERAQMRWDALVKRDFAAAYSLTSPGYRATADLARFRRGIGNAVSWTGAKVTEVTCESAERCTARVRVEAKPTLMRGFGGTIETFISETWLLDQGQWWLFQRL